VYTYPVQVNLTLSIDDRLLEKARKRASEMGTTVNQLVRDHLQEMVGENDIEAAITFLRETSGQGKPAPDSKWNREEIYQERLDRYGKP
jgi:antitoxin component of RelBE/YafQ-DinJ toxin-antitoxin module